MQEFFSLNKTLYITFAIICQIFVFIKFYILSKENVRRKYLSILPLYYTFLTCFGFMGTMIASFKGLIFAFLFGSLWVLILVLTIKTYKLAKYNAVFDVTKVKKKCILDLILYFILLYMGL